MPNCEPLFAIRGQIVAKLEQINATIGGLQDNLMGAEMALAGAQGGAGVCLLMGPTPAAAWCGAAVGVAIAAALAAVAYYQSQLEAAQAALNEAQGALDKVDALIGHCEGLQTWQEQAAEDLFAEAPDPDELEVPEDDGGSALADAEEALAELEAFEGEGETAYA